MSGLHLAPATEPRGVDGLQRPPEPNDREIVKTLIVDIIGPIEGRLALTVGKVEHLELDLETEIELALFRTASSSEMSVPRTRSVRRLCSAGEGSFRVLGAMGPRIPTYLRSAKIRNMDGIILALQFEVALCAVKALRSDGEGTPISWSDGTMCALCGVLGRQRPLDRPHRAGRRLYPRVRSRRAPPRTRAADRRGEQDFEPDRARARGLASRLYVLRGKTGKSEVVSDLAALWPSVEKMLGRPLDPLDPETLARRELLNG